MPEIHLNNVSHKFVLNGNEYLVSKGVSANLISKTITESGTYVASDESVYGEVNFYTSTIITGDPFELNDWTEVEMPLDLLTYFTKIRYEINDGSMSRTGYLTLDEIADYTSGMDYTDATLVTKVDDNTKLFIAKTSTKLYFYQMAQAATYKLRYLYANDVNKRVDGYSEVIINIPTN